MSESYLDSLRSQIDHMKEVVAAIKSGRTTFGEFAERGRIDTTAEVLADREGRISTLSKLLEAWTNLNASRR